MFKRENWRTEKIIQGLSRIPTWKAHLLIWMAMLGGVMFAIGLFLAGPTLKANFDKVPESLALMLLGLAGFTLFFPMPYIIYLAKELQKTKARIDELESKKA